MPDRKRRRSAPPRTPYYSDIGRAQTAGLEDEWMGYEGQENYHDLPPHLRRPDGGERQVRDIYDHYYRQRVRDEIGLESGPPRHYPAGEYPESGGTRTTVGGENWNPNMAAHLERMRRLEKERQGPRPPSYNASVPPAPRRRRSSELYPSDEATRDFGRQWRKVWGGELPPELMDVGSLPTGPPKRMVAPTLQAPVRGRDAKTGKRTKDKMGDLYRERDRMRKELAEAMAESREWDKALREMTAPRRLPKGHDLGARRLMDMDPPPPPMPRLVPPSYGGYIPMDPPPPPIPRLIPPEPAQRDPRRWTGPETLYAPPAPPASPRQMPPRRWIGPETLYAPPAPPATPRQMPMALPPHRRPYDPPPREYGRRFPAGMSRIHRQYSQRR